MRMGLLTGYLTDVMIHILSQIAAFGPLLNSFTVLGDPFACLFDSSVYFFFTFVSHTKQKTVEGA